MCFFRFFNALSCAGKHATSVMFYKVKMTKKADFWPNATCHLAVHFLNTTEKKNFFWASIPPNNTLSPKNSLSDEQLFI